MGMVIDMKMVNLFKYFIILIMALKLITLNINGICCEKKQKFLFDYIKENDIKIICLQEHNLKNSNDLLDIFMNIFMLF